MNEIETMKIIAMLETNWQPMKDQEAAYELWASAFEDEPFELVRAAVMALIQTDPGEFRPTVAKVRRKMHDLLYGRRISEAEAWQLVKGCLHEAQSEPETLGGARRAWKRLPEDIQKLVTPRQLLDWNSVETGTLDTVIQSNFMRSYRDVTDRRYEKEAIPPTLGKQIKMLQAAGGVYQDPDQRPEALPEPKIVPVLPERKPVEMTGKRQAMLADFLGGTK